MSVTDPIDDRVLSTSWSVDNAASMAKRYRRSREFSLLLAKPLTAEDCGLQSMPDASPTRWHLAHTTWFFETFVLKRLSSYRPFNATYEYLFNSYYNAIGNQFPRDRRGMLSRPCFNEILAYRQHVDHSMQAALEDEAISTEGLVTIELGINHEQQHQELILTDIKHAFSCNPMLPAYESSAANASQTEANLSDNAPSERWRMVGFGEGLAEVGFHGNGFAFDNELPRHRVYVGSFEVADRCVTNAEYLEFLEDGGYRKPELWLALGWQQVQLHGWQAPLYWSRSNGDWQEFTLRGLGDLQKHAPVCHISYFEADAYARWVGLRLPTEFEWELASVCGGGNHFADQLMANGDGIHPQANCAGASEVVNSLNDMFGNCWEWTSSPYSPYPGYVASPGALGEYNGKFMCNQFVLRGGSCATPAGHIRPSYRNFFPPEARWQFSGIRLASAPFIE